MSELPPGWTEAPLEVLVDILDSARVPLNATEREKRVEGKPSDALFPYYGATGQVGEIDDFLFEEPLILLGEDGVPFFDRLRHKAYLVQGRCWVNNHAHVLRAIDTVADRRYLAGYLNIFDYNGFVTGSTRLKLTQGAMRSIPVTVAPLPEQKRIADKLDALLARVDACRGRLDRVPGILKRFRQSVLAAATSGELTREWREGRGVDLEWRQTVVEDVAIQVFDGPFGSHLKSKDYADEGVRVVRLENIAPLHFVEEKRTYIPREKYEGLTKHTLFAGDILFSSFVDEEVRVCLLPDQLSGQAINKADCFCIRTNVDRCRPAFLALRLACRSTFEALDDVVHGATRPRINLGQLREIMFELPSLDEQDEIICRTNALLDLATALELRLRVTRDYVDRTTPSTLAKAFRGELVPQDPTNEPASTLLERLRTRSASASNTGKPKRAKAGT